MRSIFASCCSKKGIIENIVPLEPTYRYVEREIIYGRCPKCQRPIFQLKEFDLLNGCEVINRDKPKRLKHVDKWLEWLEKQKSSYNHTQKIKTGNKSAMAFIYGVSKETPLGITHTGYDFNGTKRKEFVLIK